MTTENNEPADRSAVRSVTRALEILACFSPSRPAASLSEIGRETGLPLSTASRLLATLEGAKYIRRDGEGAYALGSRVLQFGLTALSMSLYEASGVHLQALSSQTGETANLGVRDEDGNVMYLRQVESAKAVRHVNWLGRVVPMQGTAIGAAMRGELCTAGYAATRATLEPDVTAVSAPVYGPLGDVVGALSVTAPSFRINDEVLHAIGLSVAAQARRLTLHIGGQQPS